MVITITILHYVTSVYLAGYICLTYLFRKHIFADITLFKTIVNINVCLCVQECFEFGLGGANELVFYYSLFISTFVFTNMSFFILFILAKTPRSAYIYQLPRKNKSDLYNKGVPKLFHGLATKCPEKQVVLGMCLKQRHLPFINSNEVHGSHSLLKSEKQNIS